MSATQKRQLSQDGEIHTSVQSDGSRTSVIRETVGYGKSAIDYEYTTKDQKFVRHKLKDRRIAFSSVGLEKIIISLQTFFLPEGYPKSVTDDYLSFQIWDSIQSLCSYLRGVLCTQALLVGVGVGREGASATSAAMTWIFRDGLGMFGGMLFAWLKATDFGGNIRKWRLFADCINDLGLTLELLSPLCGEKYFVLIVSIASLCKAMCGIAAGATRAALSQHFSKANNLADISAKEGIQETCITLIGLIIGMQCSSLLGASQFGTWLLFLTLTFIHVFANWKGMACLVLTSLNTQRSALLIQHVLSNNKHQETLEVNVLSPVDLSKKEPTVSWLLGVPPALSAVNQNFMKTILSSLPIFNRIFQRSGYEIRMGCLFSDILASDNWNSAVQGSTRLSQLLANASQCHPLSYGRYLIGVSSSLRTINVCLHASAQNIDTLEGFFTSQCLVRLLTSSPFHPFPVNDILMESYALKDRLFPTFIHTLKMKGWNLQHVHIGEVENRCRVDWTANN